MTIGLYCRFIIKLIKDNLFKNLIRIKGDNITGNIKLCLRVYRWLYYCRSLRSRQIQASIGLADVALTGQY